MGKIPVMDYFVPRFRREADKNNRELLESAARNVDFDGQDGLSSVPDALVEPNNCLKTSTTVYFALSLF